MWIMFLQYIFKNTDFKKPFFTSYFKTAMFVVYLSGFILWRPWREQCRRGSKVSFLKFIKCCHEVNNVNDMVFHSSFTKWEMQNGHNSGTGFQFKHCQRNG